MYENSVAGVKFMPSCTWLIYTERHTHTALRSQHNLRTNMDIDTPYTPSDSKDIDIDPPPHYNFHQDPTMQDPTMSLSRSTLLASMLTSVDISAT